MMELQQRLSLSECPDVLDPQQARRVLGFGKNKIYTLLNCGEIPLAFRVGKQWRIPKAGLERMLSGRGA